MKKNLDFKTDNEIKDEVLGEFKTAAERTKPQTLSDEAVDGFLGIIDVVLDSVEEKKTVQMVQIVNAVESIAKKSGADQKSIDIFEKCFIEYCKKHNVVNTEILIEE